MPAYIIAMMTVTKPDAYEGYRALAGAAVAKHGGRFLARGGKHEVLEGAFPGKRVVILEFESFEKAKDFLRLARVPGRPRAAPWRRGLQPADRRRRLSAAPQPFWITPQATRAPALPVGCVL